MDEVKSSDLPKVTRLASGVSVEDLRSADQILANPPKSLVEPGLALPLNDDEKKFLLLENGIIEDIISPEEHALKDLEKYLGKIQIDPDYDLPIYNIAAAAKRSLKENIFVTNFFDALYEAELDTLQLSELAALNNNQLLSKMGITLNTVYWIDRMLKVAKLIRLDSTLDEES